MVTVYLKLDLTAFFSQSISVSPQITQRWNNRDFDITTPHTTADMTIVKNRVRDELTIDVNNPDTLPYVPSNPSYLYEFTDLYGR